MSFNKAFIPDLDDLINRIDTNPIRVYEQYKKTDAFMGPADSMALIIAFLETYEKTNGSIPEKFTEKYRK